MSTHEFVRTNGVTLHVVIAGPESGEPVILLHGFPEFWGGWRHQIDFLAQNGFRVIVPDQRGYNLSEKPRGVANYDIDLLAADIIGLIDYFGYEKVYLAGHDWGAAVAWWMAAHSPERLNKLAILNVPYPTILGHELRKGNWQQLKKSWYVFFFQLPGIAEWAMRFSTRSDTNNLLRLSSKRDTFSDADLETYRAAWRQPGAWTGMLNWYRAFVRKGVKGLPEPPRIQVPTLILWGERDAALGKELAEKSLAVCENGRLHFYPKATHWLQHDEPEAVNQQLLSFFQ